MILDYISRIDCYADVLPNLVEAVQYATTLYGAEVGKYEKDDYFVLVQDITTEDASKKQFECHAKYADVHIVAEGEESIGYEDVANLVATQELDVEKDMQMLDGEGQYVILKPGMFCVVLPHDGHKPACSVTESQKIRKIVVKIPAKN